MISVKNLIMLALLLFMCMPAKMSYAQNLGSESETVQMDDTDVKEKKSKKKKDKDIVEIDKNFFINLAINISTILLLILLIYYPNNKNMDYVFTLITFNIVIFLLTFVLNKVKISMGAAFGLFAVFSMLRYRTEGISMKDMTYLFIFIAVGLLSAIHLEYYELIILNGIIVVVTFIMEGNIFIKREHTKIVIYENIEMIKHEHRQELLENLKQRTGLNIHKIDVTNIDFLKDVAMIKIYYYEK